MSIPPPSGQAWQPTQNPQPMAYPPPPPRKSGIPVWAWVVGCGGIGCLTMPLILAAILFPVLAKARDKARQASCMSNEKQIGLALLMYSQDYDGKLPDAPHWMEGVGTYSSHKSILQCPSDKQSPYGYAFNSAASRQNLNKMAKPESTVLVYDSTTGTKNATDALKSVPSPGRHSGTNNFAYADGHVHSRAVGSGTAGGNSD